MIDEGRSLPELVAIPAGRETMRDNRIDRVWEVTIGPFQLSKTPVTREQYDGSSVGSTLPTTEVSWFDAVRYCNALSHARGLTACYTMPEEHDDGIEWRCDFTADGFRLPTEAEWQYACRGGTTGYRYGELDAVAWFADNSGDRIREVGTRQPNAWGLYDMLGNVWEWCWDLYDIEVYGSYRILRGGSWADTARSCGATVRRRTHPGFTFDELGFRVARSMPL